MRNVFDDYVRITTSKQQDKKEKKETGKGHGPGMGTDWVLY